MQAETNLIQNNKVIVNNFRFTENMIFPSITENQENMIFTLGAFTKNLFFMQCWKVGSMLSEHFLSIN